MRWLCLRNHLISYRWKVSCSNSLIITCSRRRGRAQLILRVNQTCWPLSTPPVAPMTNVPSLNTARCRMSTKCSQWKMTSSSSKQKLKSTTLSMNATTTRIRITECYWKAKKNNWILLPILTWPGTWALWGSHGGRQRILTKQIRGSLSVKTRIMMEV